MNPECAWGACERPAKSKRGGMCGMHVERQRAGKDMDAPIQHRHFAKLEDRYVATPSGCWEWLMVNEYGYGKFNTGGRRWLAHRYMWTQHRGEIPEGLVIDHLCRNRACANPDHLEVVTLGENSRRGMHPNYVAMRADRCRKGHEFTAANTYIDKTRGSRCCRRCHADREAARVRRLREGEAA